MTQKQDLKPGTPLSAIVSIPDKPRASANIEHDSLDDIIGKYIPNTSSIEALNVFLTGLDKGGAISIIGPYGSGKSTFGIVLGQMVAPRRDPGWKTTYRMLREMAPDLAANLITGRRRAGLHEYGMIRCIATARLEPVAATILRALDNGATSYFGTTYGNGNFTEAKTLHRCAELLQKGVVPDTATVSRIVSSMAASAPVLLMIDEFGKNIEYFADGSSDGDLFLLQELAEMMGTSRGIRLHIVTIQHMAFGEYVASSSGTRTKEWAKIQGRFEMVHFTNSLEHTRTLLSSSLKYKDGMSNLIRQWAGQHAKSAAEEAGVDIPDEIVESCYPLHPLVVEALPELCSRYGQNDRTLLSFVFGRYPGTVARFIDKERLDGSGILPTMGADHLYDYFISGSAPARVGAPTSASRLVEIDTIIRDARLSDDTEQSVLKAIGLMNLIGRSGRLRASSGMVRCMVGHGAEQAIKNLESRSIITYRRHADEYRVWHGTDVNIAAKTDALEKVVQRMSYPDLMKAAMNPEPIIAARHGIRTGTMRVFLSLFAMPEDDDIGLEYDGAVIYGTADTIIPVYERPVLVSRCKDVSSLVDAATKVVILRAILKDVVVGRHDAYPCETLSYDEIYDRLYLQALLCVTHVVDRLRSGTPPEVRKLLTATAQCGGQKGREYRIVLGYRLEALRSAIQDWYAENESLLFGENAPDGMNSVLMCVYLRDRLPDKQTMENYHTLVLEALAVEMSDMRVRKSKTGNRAEMSGPVRHFMICVLHGLRGYGIKGSVWDLARIGPDAVSVAGHECGHLIHEENTEKKFVDRGVRFWEVVLDSSPEPEALYGFGRWASAKSVDQDTWERLMLRTCEAAGGLVEDPYRVFNRAWSDGNTTESGQRIIELIRASGVL